jgi:hypothetical protein
VIENAGRSGASEGEQLNAGAASEAVSRYANVKSDNNQVQRELSPRAL